MGKNDYVKHQLNSDLDFNEECKYTPINHGKILMVLQRKATKIKNIKNRFFIRVHKTSSDYCKRTATPMGKFTKIFLILW